MESEKDHVSIRSIGYGSLFQAWGITNMSHVDGVDDGVGYGVYGKTVINVGVVGKCNNGYGVYGLSNNRDGVVGFGPYGSGLFGLRAMMAMVWLGLATADPVYMALVFRMLECLVRVLAKSVQVCWA